MKKIKAINQSVIQKISQKEKQTNPGQKKSITNKKSFVDSIDLLFLKMELAYHYQFYKVFGNDEKLNEGKKLWATSLKKFSPETILKSAEIIVNENSYLPTLTDVLKCCSTIINDTKFPSAQEAYEEALMSFSPRNKYSWSHPIIYYVGKKIGWGNLIDKKNESSFKLFAMEYEKLKTQFINGKKFDIKKSDSDKSKKKFNLKLLEKLRKKHNI